VTVIAPTEPLKILLTEETDGLGQILLTITQHLLKRLISVCLPELKSNIQRLMDGEETDLVLLILSLLLTRVHGLLLSTREVLARQKTILFHISPDLILIILKNTILK
jgi:hypothetical protein